MPGVVGFVPEMCDVCVGWLYDVCLGCLMHVCLIENGLLIFGICRLLLLASFSFVWAVAVRFMWGALNGNIGVAKTYLSEVP